MQQAIVNACIKNELSILNSCWENFPKYCSTDCKEGIKKLVRRKQTRESSHDTTCRCQLVYQIWVSNTDEEISFTKSVDSKKKEQIQEKPFSVLSPTCIHFTCTKSKFPILYGCRDIFWRKRVTELWKDGQTEGRTSGTKDICKPFLPLHFSNIWVKYIVQHITTL